MRWLILSAMLLVNVGVVAKAQTTASFHSTWENKRYDFHITQEQLKSKPSWLNDQDAPPLAPRIALRNAQKALQEIIPITGELKLAHISLTPMWESWIYLVDFAEPRDNPKPPRRFTVLVLMDGEIVRPMVTELRTRVQ